MLVIHSLIGPAGRSRVAAACPHPWFRLISVCSVIRWAKTPGHKEVTTEQQRRIARPRSASVEAWVGMTVNDVSRITGRSLDQLSPLLKSLINVRVTHNTILDDQQLIAHIIRATGFTARFKAKTSQDRQEDKDAHPRPPAPANLCRPRPPVVTIMGHVDHGKTTLLDSLRSSRLVDAEFGGITQHLAAFSVPLPGRAGQRITVLDTPGHAAFAAMRARGAHCTDMVVLVVAADDGVMPQTVESIRFAKEARVPIVVAVNKIDKKEANVERVHQGLAMHGVMVEAIGGEVQAVPISALHGRNLDQLQEAILTQAEVMEIAADYTGPVEGVVLEARTVTGVGMTTTCLIQRGTLKRGAVLVAGECPGRVRTMRSDVGQLVDATTPGNPVEITGWKDLLPTPGDVVLEVESQSRALEVVRYRREQRLLVKATDDLQAYNSMMAPYRAEYDVFLSEKNKLPRHQRRMTRSTVTVPSPADNDTRPTLYLLIKADVQGSLEAVLDLLDTHDSDLCRLSVVHAGVGPLTESDVTAAVTFKAVVYLFNTGTNTQLEQLAPGIDVREFKVIYQMMDDVKQELQKRIPPTKVEEVIGEAVIRRLFKVTENDTKVLVTVAGCLCTKGTLHRNKHFRVLRPPSAPSGPPQVTEDDLEARSTLIGQGLVCRSLRHVRTDVESIKRDVECGLVLARSGTETQGGELVVQDLQAGDILQCYQLVDKSQTLDWDLGF